MRGLQLMPGILHIPGNYILEGMFGEFLYEWTISILTFFVASRHGIFAE